MGSRKFLEIVVGRMTRYSKEIKLQVVVKHLPTRARLLICDSEVTISNHIVFCITTYS